MAFTEQGLLSGQRQVFYDMVDRPAQAGARRISVPVLLPYSLLTVNGVDYLETNSTSAISEGGGFHALPSHGNLIDSSYAERSKGVSAGSGDGASPASSILHKQGWI